MPLPSGQHRTAEAIPAFRTALAFLTRIPCAPAKVNVSGSVSWYGAAGIVVGFFSTGIALLFWYASQDRLPAIAALAAGWLYVAAEAWFTRGLHWDGAADMGDALGSGAGGDKFWQILKDSRLGAFGAMSILFLSALQANAAALLLYKIFANGPAVFLPLTLAPAWARLTPAWLGSGGTAYGSSFLGAMICSHVTHRIWLLAWMQAAAILLLCLLAGLSAFALLLLLAAQIAINCYFRQLGKLHGGISGDFFGCLIVVSQTAFLLFAACAFSPV